MIYAEGALLRYLTVRAKGFDSEAQMLTLKAAVDSETAAADANHRAATEALLQQFGLDENLKRRPDAKE